jgi:hypothetical protein
MAIAVALQIDTLLLEILLARD